MAASLPASDMNGNGTNASSSSLLGPQNKGIQRHPQYCPAQNRPIRIAQPIPQSHRHTKNASLDIRAIHSQNPSTAAGNYSDGFLRGRVQQQSTAAATTTFPASSMSAFGGYPPPTSSGSLISNTRSMSALNAGNTKMNPAMSQFGVVKSTASASSMFNRCSSDSTTRRRQWISQLRF